MRRAPNNFIEAIRFRDPVVINIQRELGVYRWERIEKFNAMTLDQLLTKRR